MKPLLEVKNLSISLAGERTTLTIVDDIGFSLGSGRVLSLVGESGSGKTTLCRSLTRLGFSSDRLLLRGSVLFNETDLLHCSEDELRRIRKKHIRYIFQEPQQALNPIATVRKQMKLAADAELTTEERLQEVLRSVGLDKPGDVLRMYPHQLSVGMAQRVMTAMALLPKPTLLIADEPTSALDTSLRNEIFALLESFQSEEDRAMILVTHDVEVARKYADDIAVMRAGKIVEYADAVSFFRNPGHPYSHELLRATATMKSFAEHHTA